MERRERLQAALSDDEWRELMSLVPDAASLPFDQPEQLDGLIATADDPLMELLIKCQAVLEADLPPELPAPRTDAMLVFEFEPASKELEHFLGSLRRNGFHATTLEGAQATVHVFLDGVTDQEFFHLKETVRSLHEFARMALGRNPKGRRLHTS